MTLEAYAIILFIISLILFIISYKTSKKTRQYNYDIENKNRALAKEYDDLKERINIANQTKAKADDALREKQEQLDWLTTNFNKNIEYQKNLSKTAFEAYCDLLLKNYEEKEQEYQQLVKSLDNSYAQQQESLMKQHQAAAAELESLKATRDAIIAARVKEQEIKEKRSFYCLTIKDTELEDIKLLEKVKVQLNNPRILSMLIWTTYFQKPMSALCNNVLGTGDICGIYKITNQNDDMCYIGQSVDVATRWKAHAKCGLGIDAPAGNKLYKAMQEQGIWSFSWELLEACPREELNAKEKYYIELYKTYDYGYNSNTGVGK